MAEKFSFWEFAEIGGGSAVALAYVAGARRGIGEIRRVLERKSSAQEEGGR